MAAPSTRLSNQRIICAQTCADDQGESIANASVLFGYILLPMYIYVQTKPGNNKMTAAIGGTRQSSDQHAEETKPFLEKKAY